MKTALHMAALILVTSLSMSAQLGNGLIATVPFGFLAGEKSLPAGEYHVYAGPASGVVTIRSRDGKTGVFLLSQRSESLEAPNQSTLVFHRYGSRYFLSQIWVEGHRSGVEFRPSSTEVRAARELAAAKEAVPASTIAFR
jgi:hypothetical protein